MPDYRSIDDQKEDILEELLASAIEKPVALALENIARKLLSLTDADALEVLREVKSVLRIDGKGERVILELWRGQYGIKQRDRMDPLIDAPGYVGVLRKVESSDA